MEITQDDLDFARDTLGPDATADEVRDLAEQRADRDAPEIVTNRYAADDLQAGFLAAWRDLRDRVNSGIDRLHATARDTTQDDQDRARLGWKHDGLDDALAIWERLNDRVLDGSLDPAGAWRTFTDQVRALFGTADTHPGYYQGVHLALTYQRGYGSSIDAPVIANPHA